MVAMSAGMASVSPLDAPDAARANSRPRLSMCSLAASNRSVGTSPSSTVKTGSASLSSGSGSQLSRIASMRSSATASSTSIPLDGCPSTAGITHQTTFPALVRSTPTSRERLSIRASPRPVIDCALGNGRTGVTGLASSTSIRTDGGITVIRTTISVPACRIALVTSSLTASSASATTSGGRSPVKWSATNRRACGTVSVSLVSRSSCTRLIVVRLRRTVLKIVQGCHPHANRYTASVVRTRVRPMTRSAPTRPPRVPSASSPSVSSYAVSSSVP
jgi:hypothetical protein